MKVASALQWPSSTVAKIGGIGEEHKYQWKWPSAKGKPGTPLQRVRGMLGYLSEKWLELCCDPKTNVSKAPGFEAPLGYYVRELRNNDNLS